MPEHPELTNLTDLYQHLSLREVSTVEYSGRVITEEAVEVRAEVTGISGFREEADEFYVVMSLSAQGHGAEYDLAVEATYDIDPPARWSDDLELEFVQKSGFITLAPFMREALTSLGNRIQRPVPMLPLQGPLAPETIGLVRADAHLGEPAGS